MAIDPDDDRSMQEWRPPRGPLTRIVAMAIIAMIVLGTAVMLIVALRAM